MPVSFHYSTKKKKLVCLFKFSVVSYCVPTQLLAFEFYHNSLAGFDIFIAKSRFKGIYLWIFLDITLLLCCNTPIPVIWLLSGSLVNFILFFFGWRVYVIDLLFGFGQLWCTAWFARVGANWVSPYCILCCRNTSECWSLPLCEWFELFFFYCVKFYVDQMKWNTLGIWLMHFQEEDGWLCLTIILRCFATCKICLCNLQIKASLILSVK